MIKSIIAIDINDGALISFIEIGNIREEDQYGGLLVTKLLNLKIEKSELVNKLNILNKEIEYNSDRIKTRNVLIFS